MTVPTKRYAVTRKAGLLETFCIQRKSLDYYTDVVMWATFNAHVSRPRIYHALANMVSRNPAMRAHVLDPLADFPTLAYFDTIDFDKVVEYRTVQEVNMEQLMTEFDKVEFDYGQLEEPLWKVWVLNGKTVVLAFDHAALDGTSGAVCLVQISEFLNDDIVEENVPTLAKFDALVELNPTIDDILPPNPNWVLPPVATTPRRDPSIFAQYACPTPGDRWRIVNIPGSSVATLLAECRKRKVALTALFHTALLTAMSRVYPTSEGFDTMIPISSRRFFPAQYPDPASIMGNYFYHYKEISRASTLFHWEEVIRFDEKVKLSSNDHTKSFILENLVPQVGRIREVMQSKMGKLRENDVALSNLGAYKFPKGGPFEVQTVGFSQSNAPIMPPIKLNCVGVLGGDITLVLGCAESVTGKGKCDAITDEVVKVLDEILDGATLKQ
ncbi:alcohol acetyltransferase [Lipomyces orientalis]|uniref:Alcohol acetyltransferase n=1 Tax=Lipomyces orientalis TaxID=1233043 RepID=A0ACC3TQ46_9ASCO